MFSFLNSKGCFSSKLTLLNVSTVSTLRQVLKIHLRSGFYDSQTKQKHIFKKGEIKNAIYG